MSASNGGLPSEEGKNFFTSFQAPFPDIIDGKINTVQFLEAAKGVVTLVERFGKVFSPVRYDMAGNVDKLTQKYELDTERFAYINDMVLFEKSAGEMIATDALLWLVRALNLVQRFFELILEDNDLNSEAGSEELDQFLKTAYKETLKDHHGWMAQQLFTLLSRMCPTRTQLMAVLALGRDRIDQEAVFRDMHTFTSKLSENIVALKRFYADNDLENYPKP